MKRFGIMLVFREGISREEIADSMNKIRNILDPQYLDQFSEFEESNIRSFEDKWGGPVWYIP